MDGKWCRFVDDDQCLVFVDNANIHVDVGFAGAGQNVKIALTGANDLVSRNGLGFIVSSALSPR